MPVLVLSAALGAAMTWAVASLIAHIPARSLGAFEFTRVQQISASALLVMIVTATGGWASVAWEYWPDLVFSGVVGGLVGNLALSACLRRGGPRRTQVLTAMSAPIAGLLSFAFLGESLSLLALAGTTLTTFGVVMAILFAAPSKAPDTLEDLNGSLRAVVLFGLVAASCNAASLIAIKPAMIAGTEPLAASALRISVSALGLVVLTVWPAKAFEPNTRPTGGMVLLAIVPGILGYVIAVTLMLYALKGHSTGLAVVLGSTSPVMILPLIWITTRKRPALPAWGGAGLVAIGIALIARD